MAAKWGKTDIVQLLFQSGAQLESRDQNGLTALHHGGARSM